MIPAAAAAAIMNHGFLADWSAFAMTCREVARQVAERREILLRRDPSFPDDEFFALPAVRRRLRAVLRRSLSLAVLERGIKAMSAKLGPERVKTLEPAYEELFVRPALVDVPQHEDPPTAELGVDDTHRFVLGVRLASGGETTLRVLRPSVCLFEQPDACFSLTTITVDRGGLPSRVVTWPDGERWSFATASLSVVRLHDGMISYLYKGRALPHVIDFEPEDPFDAPFFELPLNNNVEMLETYALVKIHEVVHDIDDEEEEPELHLDGIEIGFRTVGDDDYGDLYANLAELCKFLDLAARWK